MSLSRAVEALSSAPARILGAARPRRPDRGRPPGQPRGVRSRRAVDRRAALRVARSRNSAFIGRDAASGGSGLRRCCDGRADGRRRGRPRGDGTAPRSSPWRTAPSSGDRVRRRRRGVRRGRLQHRDGRLPGGPDRSVVRGADRDDDGPPAGQLRGARRRRRESARIQVAGFAVTGGVPARLEPAGGRHPRRRRSSRRAWSGSRASIHARLTLRIRDAGAMRCGISTRRPRSGFARRPGPGHAGDGRRRPRAHRHDAASRIDGERARRSRRRRPMGRVLRVAVVRLRDEAEHPADAGGRRSATPPSSRRRLPAATSLAGDFDGVLLVERARRSGGDARTESPRRASCSAGSRCSGSASGISCLALALGGRTYKMPFGHRGVNQPVRDTRTGEVRDHQPQPRVRGGSRRAGNAARTDPRPGPRSGASS